MRNNRLGRRFARCGLLAALTAGCLLNSNCLAIWQREVEVLSYPEVSTELLYDSILANNQLGRWLIKFWNIRAF